MLVLGKENFELRAYSENWPGLGKNKSASLIGLPVESVLPEDFCQVLRLHVRQSDADLHYPLSFDQELQDGSIQQENVIIHQQDDYLVLEFEARIDKVIGSDFMLRVDQSLRNIQACKSLEETFHCAVAEAKKLTGFDRVMLYEFDDQYNGTVVAEDRDPSLSAFLGLRYPHTDIPKQARDLYLIQEIRHIVSTEKDSDVLLISETDDPINLTQADNRGVSPIHLEYLRAMEVGASMSIAISFDNRLWGLISCHHRTEKLIDYRLRRILKFLARVVSGHIALQKGAGYQEGIRKTAEIRSRLIKQMSKTLEIQSTLLDEKNQLLELMNASCVAVLLNGEFQLQGDCPTIEELEGLIEFLTTKERNCWHTDTLFTDYPASREFACPQAGLLALRLTRDPAEYILWFRPETIQTVEWGGRPDQRKLIEDGQVKLHPELSFRKYTESVKGKALPWKTHEIDAAMALRNDLKEVILMKFQQVNGLNNRLVTAYDEMESFSYTVSHDLRAPLRSIKGYAEILEEDYADVLDEYGRSALNIITDNVGRMNQFISDILEFSRLGRSEIRMSPVALTPMVEELWQDIHGRKVPDVSLKLDFTINTIESGSVQLRQIFLNLLTNGIKYSRNIDDPWIKLRSFGEGDATVIEVEDNGIGFDMKHAKSIFTVFNRLVPDSEYEGSGVGLAIVKRLVGRLNGEITVQSNPGVGTTFTIRFLNTDTPSPKKGN